MGAKRGSSFWTCGRSWVCSYPLRLPSASPHCLCYRIRGIVQLAPAWALACQLYVVAADFKGGNITVTCWLWPRSWCWICCRVWPFLHGLIAPARLLNNLSFSLTLHTSSHACHQFRVAREAHHHYTRHKIKKRKDPSAAKKKREQESVWRGWEKDESSKWPSHCTFPASIYFFLWIHRIQKKHGTGQSTYHLAGWLWNGNTYREGHYVHIGLFITDSREGFVGPAFVFLIRLASHQLLPAFCQEFCWTERICRKLRIRL